MTDDERITKIQRARTQQDLERALDGFQEQIMAAYVVLQANYAFNLALERKQYFHALCDIKRASRGLWGGGYHEIIKVLEYAANKQFALTDKESAS